MRKNVKFFALGALLGLVLTWSALALAAPAEASFLDQFWKSYTGGKTSTSTAAKPAPKPIATPLSPAAAGYEEAVIAAVRKASPAVVAITISKNVPIIENCPSASSPFADLPPEFQQFFGGNLPQFYAPCKKGEKLQKVGGGSGFVISADGLIVTNRHVVADTEAAYTVFTNDGKKYDAEVLARDPVQDLAVIKVKASGLPTVELGDSNNLQLGQTAIVIGNALGEYRNTVSRGVISGLARTVTAAGAGMLETIRDVIQTDAAINPGNSGGPLLNLQGQVIGINTAMASDAQSIGFAIPIDRVKRAIESVRRVGKIETAYLGVRYMAVTPDSAKEQNLPVDYGALIRGSNDGPAVVPGGPAEKAGLQAEDIILEVDGVKLDMDHPLGNLIADHAVGDTVTLKIWRRGQNISLKVTVGQRPEK
ncbi:MAG: trypsin-like peptidase domain-containing protein [Candidatus Liptonbacteria bacterium]|nr:trypsin-like peptidase domain-containing protein [Candidatus Liptonbacteria bacterium]